MKNIDDLFRDEESFKKEKYSKKEIKLTNDAVDPFQTWSDWYGENGEAVITFVTMKQHLYTNWAHQAITSNTMNPATVNGEPVSEENFVEIINHERFENDFDGPGIYLDGTYYNDDNSVDESYTIILPEEFMTEEMCRAWIKKLNERYNRKFYIEDKDYDEKKLEFHAEKIKKQIEKSDDPHIGTEAIKTVLRNKIL